MAGFYVSAMLSWLVAQQLLLVSASWIDPVTFRELKANQSRKEGKEPAARPGVAVGGQQICPGGTKCVPLTHCRDLCTSVSRHEQISRIASFLLASVASRVSLSCNVFSFANVKDI